MAPAATAASRIWSKVSLCLPATISSNVDADASNFVTTMTLISSSSWNDSRVDDPPGTPRGFRFPLPTTPPQRGTVAHSGGLVPVGDRTWADGATSTEHDAAASRVPGAQEVADGTPPRPRRPRDGRSDGRSWNCTPTARLG